MSAFVQTDVETLHGVTFVRYLDTGTFSKMTVSMLDKEGYLICCSSKYIIFPGIHVFKCSNGSSILYQYICDGTTDCPNDKSDEELCVCSDSTESKMCKIINTNKQICFLTYYMVQNGQCLKYIKHDTIDKQFNIDYCHRASWGSAV